jgi:peroxiredoxin family protein
MYPHSELKPLVATKFEVLFDCATIPPYTVAEWVSFVVKVPPAYKAVLQVELHTTLLALKTESDETKILFCALTAKLSSIQKESKIDRIVLGRKSLGANARR